VRPPHGCLRSAADRRPRAASVPQVLNRQLRDTLATVPGFQIVCLQDAAKKCTTAGGPSRTVRLKWLTRNRCQLLVEIVRFEKRHGRRSDRPLSMDLAYASHVAPMLSKFSLS
jgi:hypothetical protein